MTMREVKSEKLVREKVHQKVNLANLGFSLPEIESSYLPGGGWTTPVIYLDQDELVWIRWLKDIWEVKMWVNNSNIEQLMKNIVSEKREQDAKVMRETLQRLVSHYLRQNHIGGMG